MYTTRLCSLISSFSLSRRLHADYTQLFFSFHPLDIHSSLTYLYGALQQISSWMTSNRLTLNSSKTEFLFIGLQRQLAKLQTISLNTTHSARNLGSIFDENLTFSDQISSLSGSRYYHIRQLRYIRPYLDFKTANTIVTSTVLNIPNSTTVTLCSLYFNLPNPKTQINRLQHIQNSLLASSLTHLILTHHPCS